ncbi:hypothetical protein MPL3356_210027 [Mesorhizobium plurifarium]|uniref:Uncharacterized protein n=1 Tax=Mesorhizobium plurifarium TaxID=69974 RepID=A0A090FAU6_MESPL|nr:hypothetical protein MPL3356_210027 [Mesorhizobium plurifarium]CDX40741.1 hypothetical protein MPLDJ20_30030 [Mesorhizobium plurifarium]
MPWCHRQDQSLAVASVHLFPDTCAADRPVGKAMASGNVRGRTIERECDES